VIVAKDKREFWAVVRDCLVRLHGVPGPMAQAKCDGLRRKIESPPDGVSPDIFYHNEPFDVACDLAESELDFEHFRSEYEQILAAHSW
jgi:hypothetical protein